MRKRALTARPREALRKGGIPSRFDHASILTVNDSTCASDHLEHTIPMRRTLMRLHRIITSGVVLATLLSTTWLHVSAAPLAAGGTRQIPSGGTTSPNTGAF